MEFQLKFTSGTITPTLSNALPDWDMILHKRIANLSTLVGYTVLIISADILVKFEVDWVDESCLATGKHQSIR